MNEDGIPDDIRSAAVAVVDRGYNEGLIDAVCAALMAERERCAKVCEDMTWYRLETPTHVISNSPADYAAAIRVSPAKEGSP